MTNPSKAKGTVGETRVRLWLNANGFPDAQRRALAGAKDVGDLYVTRNIIAEVKNVKEWTAAQLNGWVQETRTEASNAQSPVAVLVVLLPRKQVQAALAIELSNAWQLEFVGSLEQWAARHA